LATHHRGKQKYLGILAIVWQHAGQPGFFLRILWYSQGGNHSKTILANSGYMLDMKIEKNPGSFYILGYQLKLIVESWQFEFLFFSKFGKFGPFSPWKLLCIGQNHIFQVEFLQKILPIKKNTGYNLLSKYDDFEKISHNVAIVGHFFTQKKHFILVIGLRIFSPKNISTLIGGPFWLIVHF